MLRLRDRWPGGALRSIDVARIFRLCCPARAVINGFIAIIISMLPIRRSVLKLRLGVAALILGALAVGAGYYAKYAARGEVAQQQALRDQVRDEIQTRILEGRTLLGQIRDARRELPSRPADEWALRSENYLRDKLGERYVQRFRKVQRSLRRCPDRGPRMGYWRAVRNRVVALELIAAELTEPPDVAVPAPPVASTAPPAATPAPPAAAPARPQRPQRRPSSQCPRSGKLGSGRLGSDKLGLNKKGGQPAALSLPVVL